MMESKFKKLKIAIGVHGNVVFLEKFPDDEHHAYMNDDLSNVESDSTFKDAPGIYLATLEFNGGQGLDYNGEPNDYLAIVEHEKLEKLKL